MVDNRSRIIETALELFASRGYDGVGIQEIVDRAGITKPTLYHYFGSKRGLLDAVLGSRSRGLERTLREATDYRHDLPLTLYRVTMAYFQFASREPTYYRLLLSLWFAPIDGAGFRAVAPLHEAQHQMLETMFLMASEDHGNMRGRHRAYAATFSGMINTYIGLALNGYAELDEPLARAAVHQFSHGIYS